MAYIQAADNPPSNAGVYYTTSVNNGATWNIPTLVYGSSYYIRRAELDDEDPRNTVDLSVTSLDGKTGVFVTFDNLSRKRVLFSRLLTDGKSWEEPVEVDGPATLGGSTIPFQISVSASQENVLMTWQVGQPGGVCLNYFVVSQNAGETWSERQRANLPYVDCAQDRRLKSGVGEYTLQTDTVKGQMYFTAWNGKEWSQTQTWPELFEFVDPEIAEQRPPGMSGAGVLAFSRAGSGGLRPGKRAGRLGSGSFAGRYRLLVLSGGRVAGGGTNSIDQE